MNGHKRKVSALINAKAGASSATSADQMVLRFESLSEFEINCVITGVDDDF